MLEVENILLEVMWPPLSCVQVMIIVLGIVTHVRSYLWHHKVISCWYRPAISPASNIIWTSQNIFFSILIIFLQLIMLTDQSLPECWNGEDRTMMTIRVIVSLTISCFKWWKYDWAELIDLQCKHNHISEFWSYQYISTSHLSLHLYSEYNSDDCLCHVNIYFHQKH